ncbi:trypsin-like serine peptidase [Celeribacter indicus]|uniref:Serine protease-like protein n=1 Tax=Celeribacter indicus TaxID=1208324 RepID=A0A0B5DXV8_9RHOB|nr:trypsin-like peptidase domain-containing protein [Celeribacter indicus]AJE45571.1 serine protease-like protein [Celeribacter indicus]SDW85742.1 protease YdgD [Celeribacter indicus]
MALCRSPAALVRGLVFALILPAALPAADSLPSELDAAERRAELLGWEAVGRLDIAGRSTCSGTLIAADLVLTAAHCVVDTVNVPVPAGQILFRAGLRNGDAIAASRAIALAVAPGYDVTGDITAQNIRHDLALIRLASPIPAALARPFPIHRGPQPRGELMVASYGQGRNSVLSIQRECHVLDHESGIYAFDCDVTFGSSGAPVFAHDGVRPAILSVVSAMGTRDGRKLGFGMALADAVPALERQLALGAPAAPPPPVTARRLDAGAADRTVGNAKFLPAR